MVFTGMRRLGFLLFGLTGGVVLAVAAAGLLIPAAALGRSRPPALAWSPTTSTGTFAFGATSAGNTSTQTFTLTNTGGKSSGALKVSVSGASAFTTTNDRCNGALGPNKSCNVTVRYAPSSNGESDAATLNANGKHASTSLDLSGSTTSPNPFAQSQSDCEALGGTFSTDPATNGVPGYFGTFVWSCNNGPSQAFDQNLGQDCATSVVGGSVLAFSQSAPFDSTCFKQQ